MEIIMSVGTNKAGAPDFSTAEPVTTCKDCRHCKMKRTKWRGEPFTYYRCAELEREVDSCDFCAWAESK